MDDYCFDYLFAFLSVLTCMSFDFEDAFINWLAHFIFSRLLDIHKKVMVEPPKMVKTTSSKAQSLKICKVNQGGISSDKSVTRSPKICSEHVSYFSRNVFHCTGSVVIKQ